ncbi:hypothetical protein DFH06DRAFT_690339 [Mycena polygramma]|nr:hypothetical protein DFH06DRAFT_210942 [Mycena polygramma]KAJ7633310.1 hypothetical protein DFH06DRAFT_690339 [Mycena polygramma]
MADIPCPDPSTSSRTLFDIIWGCLATVFACTWVAVHPNLPAPKRPWVFLASRRLGMMLLAIIAPELIVFFAARQFFFARAFSQRFHVSWTHGFFFAMGGFVSGDEQHPITALEQLEDPVLGEQYLADIRAIDCERIMDKSKGDALSKGLALMQSFWFITQCVARLLQRLPLTELEVATLAFAVVNIVTWTLWFKKPLDVQVPIPIGPLAGKGRPPAEKSFKLPSDIFTFRTVMQAIYGPEDYDPASSTASAVPVLWSPFLPQYFRHTFLLEVSVAITFGAIHCAGWAASFPSTAEKWLWRMSAAMVTLVPLLMGVEQAFDPGDVPRPAILYGLLMATLTGYVVCRLLLIVLPFTALRSVPAGALTDIDWSAAIPHI